MHPTTDSTASASRLTPSIAPQLPAALRRRLRTVTLAALAVFAVCFVLAYIACSLCAGSLEFWHVWGWFGYA